MQIKLPISLVLAIGLAQSALAMDVPWVKKILQYTTNQTFTDASSKPVKYLELLKRVIKRGADVNAINGDGHTALMEAAYASDAAHEEILTDYAKLLIDHGACVNIQSYCGNTALLFAAMRKNTSLCELLLSHGADLSIKNHRDDNPLKDAIGSGNRSMVVTFITHACFNPTRAAAELRESCDRIFTTLCIFKHLCPQLPKDLKAVIFAAEDNLWNDFCNCPSGLHARQPKRITKLPLPVIRSLLQNNKLNAEIIVKMIKNHKYDCLIPLMADAQEVASTQEVRDLLNPELLEQNFGQEIEQNIRRRLGLQQIEESKEKLIEN